MAWIAQQLLTAIRDSGMRECITEARLVELTGLTLDQIGKSALVLRRRGLLEKTGQGCHKLTSAGREALAAGVEVRTGPKNGKGQTGCRVWKKETMRVRLWRAMRLRRKFTVPELITLAVDGNERGDVTGTVQRYVSALGKAGYLVELSRREAGRHPGYKRWWLMDEKDTGPLAPIWRVPQQKVYDPNTEKTHDISGKKEAP